MLCYVYGVVLWRKLDTYCISLPVVGVPFGALCQVNFQITVHH